MAISLGSVSVLTLDLVCRIFHLVKVKVTEYRGGVVFLSTSTDSSHCTVALSVLKITQYEANDTSNHWKSREVHN